MQNVHWRALTAVVPGLEPGLSTLCMIFVYVAVYLLAVNKFEVSSRSNTVTFK